MQGAAVSGDPGEHGGGVAQPYRASGADVHDALRGGQGRCVHGACHVPYVDEVALHAEPGELELAVAGLHGPAHRLGEAAERRSGGRAGPDRREHAQHDGVEARAEHQLGGRQLADSVRSAGARHGVLGGGGAGLGGPVLGGTAELDQARPAAAATEGFADGGDGDGVVPGEVAGTAPGGTGAVDDDSGVHGVQEPGEGSGAAGGEVEPHVGVVAPAEGGELDGGVGEEPVRDEAAEVSVGAEQEDPHRVSSPRCRRARTDCTDRGGGGVM
ncbi:hypothetical protein SSPIM334S_03357 [Streptomyces spiroverticillatus]